MFFKTMTKYTIPPGQSLTIQTIANGPALNAFHPVTALCSLIDGQSILQARLNIKILPSIQILSHPNNCMYTLIASNFNIVPKNGD